MDLTRPLTRSAAALAVALFFFGAVIPGASAAEDAAQVHTTVSAQPDRPSYKLELSLAEFSMFNNSLLSGLGQYNGRAELGLEVASFKQAGPPAWIVTVQEPGALQACSVWAAQQLVQVVQEANLANPDPNTTQSMQAIGTLSSKIESAIQQPVWPVKTYEGTFKFQNDLPYLALDSGDVFLKDDGGLADASWDGQRVRVAATYRQQDALQLNAIAPVTSDTLHVFIMSQCPYGQQVAQGLLQYADAQTTRTPKVEVHYISYRLSSAPGSRFFALHGPAELQENLLQIAIRDNHPQAHYSYLRARFSNPTAPWVGLARQVDIDQQDIADLERIISTGARATLQKEFDEVHHLWGVEDKSPTYIVGGQQVDDPRQAPGFEDFNPDQIPTEACSQ